MTNSETLGGSLAVENIQALAAKELKEIPDRYVRPEIQSESISVDKYSEIPVIDLTKLLDQELACDEMAKFHSACKDWGFFQLINHGVPEEIIEKMKTDIQDFLKLPLEEKEAYSQTPNGLQGYGQAFVVSDEQKLDWSDMLFLISLPKEQRDMRFWPNCPTSFRETLEEYSLAVERVAISLMGLMAKNLGIEPEQLMNMFDKGQQGLRMNHYSPCPSADKVLGITPHCDAAALTILLQASDTNGLQIRNKGSWVPVIPISGAFVVNIGDTFEILSNGIYKSIEHRAMVNPEKERLSIAAFNGLNFNSMIGPLPDLVKKYGQYYKTLSQGEYFKIYASHKLDGKNNLDFMKQEDNFVSVPF